MPDTMNDEFLMQRDISDPAMGFVLMAAVYVGIPVTLWLISKLWDAWKSKRRR